MLLPGIVAGAAAVRFATLGRQGFWYDESFTAFIVSLPPGHALEAIPKTESTPPLYYLFAWPWSQLFGGTEMGLRSLSAVIGVAAVPLMYLATRELASRRAGVVAASLAATSPLLVWYSQEARSYSLLTLLSALGLWLFARARRQPDRLRLVAWAACSTLALATHYFAVLVVVPEAILLLQRHRGQRRAWTAVMATVLTGGALLPLAVEQLANHHTYWIAHIPLGLRLGQVLKQFLAGFGAASPMVLVVAAALCLGALLLARADRRSRQGASLAAAVGGMGLLLALCLGQLGADRMITRNLIAAWPPLAVAASIGLAQGRPSRVGVVAAVVVCATWMAVDLRVAQHPGLQRPDWRKVIRLLGSPTARRLLVLEHYRSQLPLRIYDPRIRRVHRRQTVDAGEVDVIAPHVPRGRSCWWGAACNLSNAPLPRRPPPGLRVLRQTAVPDFRIVRYTAPHPLSFTPPSLRRELRHVGAGAILVEPARVRSGRPTRASTVR